MNVNLIVVLIFLLVMVVLFWIMSDKSASRVTNSLKSLLQVLPVSQIVRSWRDNRNMEEKKTRINAKDNGEQEINQ